MKYVLLIVFLILICGTLAYAQETYEPPTQFHQYNFEEEHEFIDNFALNFTQEEYSEYEQLSNRFSTYREEEMNRDLRRNFLQRLPNMCLVVPTNFDGDWAVGCIYHFQPRPVRIYF